MKRTTYLGSITVFSATKYNVAIWKWNKSQYFLFDLNPSYNTYNLTESDFRVSKLDKINLSDPLNGLTDKNGVFY